MTFQRQLRLHAIALFLFAIGGGVAAIKEGIRWAAPALMFLGSAMWSWRISNRLEPQDQEHTSYRLRIK